MDLLSNLIAFDMVGIPMMRMTSGHHTHPPPLQAIVIVGSITLISQLLSDLEDNTEMLVQAERLLNEVFAILCVCV